MIKFNETKKYQEAIEFRDWQTCDLIADEHKELVKIITDLEEFKKDALEVINFYDSIEGWDQGKKSGVSSYKKARDFLNKWIKND